MKIDLTNKNEYMGIFGLSWQEKVAKFMYNQLKGTDSADKLKSFWQSGGYNISIVDNLQREYMALMASGRFPTDFINEPNNEGNGGDFDSATLLLANSLQSKTNIDNVIVLSYLRAIYVLSRDGTIPFEKWNPQGYQASTNLQKTFPSEQNVFDTVKSKVETSSGYLKVISIVAVIGVSGYLLSQIKGLK